MRRWLKPLCWFGGVGWLAGAAAAEPLLARIDDPPGAVMERVPVYAALADGQGREYVLACAPPETLKAAGLRFSPLYAPARPADFVLARARRADAYDAPLPGELIADDGRNLLLRADAATRAELSTRGFALKALPARPLAPDRTAAAPPTKLAAVSYDGRVAELIGQVTATNLHALVAQWSGQAPTAAAGSLLVVTTRHTSAHASLNHALQLAEQHLRALGLAVSRQHWSAGGYSNRNVVATRPGGTLSNEIVLVLAHLDSISPSPQARAPGADDNASGSAAVLVCADLLRRFRFDRTLRFVLVTGEEQDLYGSAHCASLAAAAGEQVVAVFNLDMIAWDSGGAPTLRLHTRTTGNPGYSADRAIADTFTNVVATYGLGGSLTPLITASGDPYSDHASFWDQGFPAILAIEDDYDDFHPYYHTTNDTLPRLNLAYFTAYTKATVATVAHLAGPAGRERFDVVQVDSSDWTPGGGLGVGTFHARHQEGATEAGADPHDTPWGGAPSGRWLRVHTAPYGTNLATDARPVDSATIFQGRLTAVTTGAAPFHCTNRLRFAHLSALESNRAYLVRVQLDPRYTAGSNDFLCVTNLRPLVAGGGFIPLPALTNLTNGAICGTIDLASAPQDQSVTSCPLAAVSNGAGFLHISAPVQVGFPVVDVLEFATNLAPPSVWQAGPAVTSEARVTEANFSNGWDRTDHSATLGQAPGAAYRLHRQWRPP